MTVRHIAIEWKNEQPQGRIEVFHISPLHPAWIGQAKSAPAFLGWTFLVGYWTFIRPKVTNGSQDDTASYKPFTPTLGHPCGFAAYDKKAFKT